MEKLELSSINHLVNACFIQLQSDVPHSDDLGCLKVVFTTVDKVSSLVTGMYC